MDDTLLMSVLNGSANGCEQLQSRMGIKLVLVTILGERDTFMWHKMMPAIWAK